MACSIAIAQAMCYNGYKLNERSEPMKINVEYIKSEYPLGTTDGQTYTVTPRA